jgi:hypothetical protein
MPEFYDQAASKYQPAAQPYLDAIARSIRDSAQARVYLLEGTVHALAYASADPLWNEQRRRRDPSDRMKAPFWANYWSEPCPSCDCRIDLSVSMEIDAMFFFRNAEGRTLAIHVEMKRDRQAFSVGQAEAYRPRAACYRDRRRVRKSVLDHDDFVTVLFCGAGTDVPEAGRHFDRVISHESARSAIPGYPSD